MINRLFLQVYLVFFATGATALVYETVWQKSLIALTGNDWRGNAIILGLLLAALGLGYSYFGKLSQRYSAQKLFRLTGWIEIYIGLLALSYFVFYPIFFSFLISISSSLWLEILCSAILICPAAFLMGGNLPLITEATAQLENPSRVHANLYAANTVGAFTGCLLAGFLLIPALGLNLTLFLAVIINFIAGLVLLNAAKSAPKTKIQNTTETNLASNKSVPIFIISLCALSGFVSMGLQNILMRLLSLTFGGTEYAFTLVVASYVVLLSIGTKLLIQKFKISLLTNCLLGLIGLILIYVSVPYWPYGFHLLRIQLPTSIFGFWIYHLLALASLSLVCACAIMPLGAILPMAFNLLCTRGAQNYGDSVGKIYSANAAACFLGCIVSGYLGFNYLNLSGLTLTLIAITTLIVLIAFYYGRDKHSPRISLKIKFVALVAIILLALNSTWPISHLALGMFHEKTVQPYSYLGPSAFYEEILKDSKVLAHNDGANSSVSVVEFKSKQAGIDGRNFNRSLMINGKSDGNTEGDLIMMRLSAVLGAIWLPSEPAIKTQTTRQAAVIGYGTGLTSGILNQVPWIDSVDSVEIAKEVAEFAPYFDYANDNVSTNKKHNFVIADGFHYLGQTSQKNYNLIISQLSNFWMAGTEKLFTTEFYNLVSKRLSPDGTFVQWISLWGLSPNTARIALSTFSKSFKDTHFFAFGSSIFMIGRNQAIAIEQIKRAASNLQLLLKIPATKILGLFDIKDFLTRELWLPESALNSTQLHTLTHPTLAYLAGRDFYLDANSLPDDLIPAEAWKDSQHAAITSLTALLSSANLNWDFLKIAQQTCGSNKVNLIEPNWRYSRTPCRDALIQLMKEGRSNIPETIKPDIDWLKTFEADDNSNLPSSSYLALTEISRFAQMNSVYAPLSLKRLKWRISVCYQKTDSDSIKCRENFSKLLNDLNQLDWAKSEQSSLQRDLSALPVAQPQAN
jgi:spermidine synthase